MTRRSAVTLALAVIGFGVAAYLTYVHYAGLQPVCAVSGGCEKVQASRYAVLGGVPVALIGLIGYSGILASFLLRGDHGRMARVLMTAIGFGFSAYLTYLELFHVHAICQWCVSSAAIMTLLLILSVIEFLQPASERYSSLAGTPVSSDTTAAAGRTRAPASTSR